MMTKLAELVRFGLTPMLIGALLPAAALAEELTVEGEVTYRERIALPPDAVLTVELADVSLADAPAAIVARQETPSPGQVPLKFRLVFDSAALQESATYALQARITVKNELLFVNAERYQINPSIPGRHSLIVKSSR